MILSSVPAYALTESRDDTTFSTSTSKAVKVEILRMNEKTGENITL